MSNSALHSPYVLDKSGFWRFKDHEGQRRIMASKKRFILMLAGTQSGKTVLGPWWLMREIAMQGRGDYLVVAPTFPLMQKKVVPEFLKFFKRRMQLGEYRKADKIFELSARGQEVLFGNVSEEPTQIFFCHAQDPDSLESATAKAAWCDEPGQKKFRLGSWEALQRRLSIHEGRVLLTTTPYTLGWLKNELHDKASTSSDIELVQFASTMNPTFPRAEFERMEGIMPKWKFNMMYRGIFERPAGMIYDCFTDEHKIPRFDIPASWPRYLGLDFGGANTAGVFLAKNPSTGAFIAYREYHAGSRTAAEHAQKLRAGEGALTVFGGAGSEDNWRREFTAAGMKVHQPPIKEVEVGIDRTYELIKTDKLRVFDDLTGLIDELESYSRVLDENQEPTEVIEDKAKYHRLDALRYICSHLNSKVTKRRRFIMA